jgi:hypothetical protein
MATQKDVRIPTLALHALRRSLARESGPEAATRALQDAGHAAGDILVDRLGRNSADQDLGSTPTASFWERLATLFRELGWGSMHHEEVHPGIGALVASDWFEVDPSRDRTTCPFTTGVLANILGRTAGRDVAVMQVDGPGPQSGSVRFLFGSADVLTEVYGGLRDGRDLESALATLG